MELLLQIAYVISLVVFFGGIALIGGTSILGLLLLREDDDLNIVLELTNHLIMGIGLVCVLLGGSGGLFVSWLQG